MASLSNCDLAHLPLFWTTPSTETCWLVVSFMTTSFLGLPHEEHTSTVTSPVRAWFRAASSLRRIVAGLEGNGPLGGQTTFVTVTEAMNATSSLRARQTFHERLPALCACSNVVCTWIQRIPTGMPPYLHRTVPNGCIELTYELGAEDVAVIGPRCWPILDLLTPGETVVGLRFHPGAAPDALGVPAFELSGQTVKLTSIWGKRASTL